MLTTSSKPLVALPVGAVGSVGRTRTPANRKASEAPPKPNYCLCCWRKGSPILKHWSCNDLSMMAPDWTQGTAFHHPMKGEDCIHGKTNHSEQYFHRNTTSSHALSCVILSPPATEICLLFVHQSMMPSEQECYLRGGVGHWNTPPDNFVTAGVFRPSHHLARAVPQRQNLLCMFVRFSFTAAYIQQS